MGTWVNYRKLRESLNFRDVLESYGVKVAYKGDQATAFCPLPGHEDKKSKSFSANVTKGIFQCFGCQAQGNVLEFCIRMEGLDPEDSREFRQGAIKVQERFTGKEFAPVTSVREEPLPSNVAPKANVKRVVNAPLDFELKNVDGSHEYLKARKLSPETIDHFGIGYCGRGMMQGRIAIPLHDQAGRLIGYAGRLVDDAVLDDEHPKYLLPGKREKKGVVYEFAKGEFVFNGHRVSGPVEELIVVEGFFGAMWLHECGHENVVALMGSSCSERQAAIICDLVAPDGCVYVMPDGDAAGEKCAISVFEAVGTMRPVRWIRLASGEDPDSLTFEQVRRLLEDVGL